MANQDTGLGWNAESLYLISGTGKIGAIGKIAWNLAGYETQVVPATSNNLNDVLVSGLEYGNQPNSTLIYRVGSKSGLALCWHTNSSLYGWALRFASPIQNDEIYLARGWTDGWSIVDTGICSGTAVTSDGTTVYCCSYGGPTTWPSTFYVPEYGNNAYIDWNTPASHMISTSQDVYKLNSGYAVCCFVKWRDFAPATYWTPVLISSVENNSKLSLDGQIEYYGANTMTFRYLGMSFYMTYIRGLDGAAMTTFPTFDANAEFIGPGADSISARNVFDLIASSDFANILVTDPQDPYNQLDPSGEGGGEGDFDDEDDDIEDSALPTLSFAATGFCRIYRTNLTQLQALARYMWTDTTFIQTLINHGLQMFEDPMKAIITLNMVPVDLTGYYGGAEGVSVMYIPTGVAMHPMTSQFVPVDCGTVNLHEYFGSVLDYNPYTKVSLFLPYIGTVDLDTDEVMGKTISVKYKIDVVSGICVAIVKADNDVRYQFSGHCVIPMPLASADFTGYLQAALQVGGMIAGAAIAAGAPTQGGGLLAPPLEGGGGGSVTHRTIKTKNPDTGRMRQAAKIDTETEYKARPVSYGELIKRTSPNVIGSVMNSKLGVEHSSGFNGNSGYLGVRRPYLIIKRPNPCYPTNYGELNGRPSMIYLNLGSCTGYTEVQSIQLTGFNATNPELSEIASLLKSGVIL